MTACRVIAWVLMAYCGTLAAGLWWRITQAEERMAKKAEAEQRDEIRETIPPPRPGGRVQYAWRREDDYCGEGYGE